MKDKKINTDLVSNRKAYHHFEVVETYEAGLVLLGTEIKSLRDHGGSLAEAYVRVIKEEIWLVGASIAPYRHGNSNNHEERRDRKLLLHRSEIRKLQVAVHQKGMTLVPLKMYLKNHRAKIKIGLARGKKSIDKRATIRERDEKRNMQRAVKHHTG
jgi:SsrA-binding protein